MSKEYWDLIAQTKHTNYRKHPELYRIGKGQQGVLSVQPYSSEIVPYWRFKTEGEAFCSADVIYSLFEDYLSAGDFVGADMAKKFLHMGFTRARRYANHPSGRKYDSAGRVRPQASDAMVSEKAFSAEIFKIYWTEARNHPEYLRMKAEFTSAAEVE